MDGLRGSSFAKVYPTGFQLLGSFHLFAASLLRAARPIAAASGVAAEVVALMDGGRGGRCDSEDDDVEAVGVAAEAPPVAGPPEFMALDEPTSISGFVDDQQVRFGVADGMVEALDGCRVGSATSLPLAGVSVLPAEGLGRREGFGGNGRNGREGGREREGRNGCLGLSAPMGGNRHRGE